MAKLIKINARKAFRVEGILLDDNSPAVSVRQMYTTQKQPDVWMPGRNGLVIPLEFAGRLANAVGRTSQEDPDTFVQIGGGAQEEEQERKPARRQREAEPEREPARGRKPVRRTR